jgi:hypothetical protein
MASISLHSEKPVTITEEIEWTWDIRPPRPDPALPNVLLRACQANTYLSDSRRPEGPLRRQDR